jgi:hypothetical protein
MHAARTHSLSHTHTHTHSDRVSSITVQYTPGIYVNKRILTYTKNKKIKKINDNNPYFVADYIIIIIIIISIVNTRFIIIIIITLRLWWRIIIIIIISPIISIPWCSVLHHNLTATQLIEEFPAFYETRMFITMIKTARPWSLSWAKSTHYTPTS